MGRVDRETGEGQYKYYVEIYDAKSGKWESEVRSYRTEQNIEDYPDVEGERKNFTKLK
ncbi:hypothetical protein Calle1_83 [Cellulophaga phage Calle_1]|uniref:Uncharacterized protein n=1 Tax=Cellulophaga phage Calle_1 TaxID=2745643 RepID=A0A8E4ZKV0_9CAUD|nr:hypothetical protein M1M22_gp032 [Cellulophaga phage Calle_1]QQV89732.1 hypothetical protein Calle1_83 [Cellulophaga phage Calle_1]QQV89857.1 hypothetical protein Calle2_83 [Cellulophaga phage Calle_2]QQV89862.1 hypothetical protein Calle3_83 [Cellulophaga phage Calle_3]